MVKSNQLEFVTTFSKYICTRIIGEGGSGFVYEAKDDTGRSFAVKLLKRQGVTTDKRKRFKNEITFCQRCQHPNIVPIIDSGVLSENEVPIPFYVMPLFDSSLRMLINNNLEPKNILKLYSGILNGVEAAHLQGIIHRDLKPENILFDKNNAQLVIADFGIARFTEDELYTAVETRAQDRLANFQYAAPEQRVRGKQVDHRADIFAIGLILNEMFTHEIPQGTGYKTISSILPKYSYLDEITENMLRQNPDDRINSIDEIKKNLKVRGADYITEQKLSTLKSTVIPTQEIDDPLILTPIKVVDFEWDKGSLTLILSQSVNQRWRNALLNMGSHNSLLGKGPDSFSFDGNRAIILASEGEVQHIINYFKSWIPLVTRKYQSDLELENNRMREQKLEKIRKEIESEEANARLRKNIKL